MAKLLTHVSEHFNNVSMLSCPLSPLELEGADTAS